MPRVEQVRIDENNPIVIRFKFLFATELWNFPKWHQRATQNQMLDLSAIATDFSAILRIAM